MVVSESPAEPAAAAPGGITRRRFLAFAIAAPTLTMAVRIAGDLPFVGEAAAGAAPAPPTLPGGVADAFDLTDALVLAAAPTVHNLVVEITADNRVVMQLPRAEVGQGITTAIAMLLAEELDARLTDVDMRLQDATPSNLFNQLTGGSASVTVLYEPVRTIAAAMRARLVTAAANQWGVPAGSLQTRDTMVVAPDGRTATYGSLSHAAAQVLVPAVDPTPKDPSEFKVIGKPTTRMDARDIVTGKAKYTCDLDVAGAKPTVVARPPTIGGTVAAVNDTAARAMPGVLAITTIPTGVAVVAETFHDALKARDALAITWNPGPVVGTSDAQIRGKLEAATPPFVVPPLGSHVDGTFNFAFVNHAPLETMVAIADVRAGRAELWFPAKSPNAAKQAVAAAIGLPSSAVTCHVIRSGGSFGRRLFFDPAIEAAQISQRVGRAVKLMFTRADDMRHGRMRPVSHHKVRATMLLGAVRTYEHRVATAPFDATHGLGDALTSIGANTFPGGMAQTVFHLSQNMPYEFGLETYLLNEVPLDVPTSSWRSVYSGTVAVADEIMVDEIARQLGRDPFEFRRATLSDARGRAVLDKVAAAGNWGTRMSRGFAQGVALHEEYRGFVAYLVEIDARNAAAPRVTKVVIAADVGRCVNPRGLEAQLIGVTSDAISVMLRAGNHIDSGAVRESSYSDFSWARMRHTPPRVEVHIMPPTGEPGGAGELGYPAAAAAIANAYARATNTKPRNFPING
jgi:isoquinoline 1-oxidoreductase beta subunit